MKTITVNNVKVQCRPMKVELMFAFDGKKKEYLVRIDTKTEGVKLPGFVIRKQKKNGRVKLDDGSIAFVPADKWLAISYDFWGPTPRTNLGVIVCHNTPKEAYNSACQLYWGE